MLDASALPLICSPFGLRSREFSPNKEEGAEGETWREQKCDKSGISFIIAPFLAGDPCLTWSGCVRSRPCSVFLDRGRGGGDGPLDLFHLI